MFDGYRIQCNDGKISVDNDTLAFVGQYEIQNIHKLIPLSYTLFYTL